MTKEIKALIKAAKAVLHYEGFLLNDPCPCTDCKPYVALLKAIKAVEQK